MGGSGAAGFRDSARFVECDREAFLPCCSLPFGRCRKTLSMRLGSLSSRISDSGRVLPEDQAMGSDDRSSGLVVVDGREGGGGGGGGGVGGTGSVA